MMKILRQRLLLSDKANSHRVIRIYETPQKQYMVLTGPWSQGFMLSCTRLYAGENIIEATESLVSKAKGLEKRGWKDVSLEVATA